MLFKDSITVIFKSSFYLRMLQLLVLVWPPLVCRLAGLDISLAILTKCYHLFKHNEYGLPVLTAVRPKYNWLKPESNPRPPGHEAVVQNRYNLDRRDVI